MNNWWIVKRPDREDLAVHEPIDVIKDGDVIQLVHGMTHNILIYVGPDKHKRVNGLFFALTK